MKSCCCVSLCVFIFPYNGQILDANKAATHVSKQLGLIRLECLFLSVSFVSFVVRLLFYAMMTRGAHVIGMLSIDRKKNVQHIAGQ